MSEDKDKSNDKTNPPAKKVKEVEVICEGTLGRKLLKKGDRTHDPEYIALLNDKRGLVRAID